MVSRHRAGNRRLTGLILALFIATSVAIFFVANLYILGTLLLLELAALLALKIFNRKLLQFIKIVLPFVLLAGIFNWFFGGVQLALITSGRLFIMCLLTYIIGQKIPARRIGDGIAGLLSPLRVFRVSTDDIATVIAIALSLVPILADEARQIELSLRAKGFAFSLANLVQQPHLFVATYMQNIFRKVARLELALKAKGYS
jgi:energy-coupling factor transporter transmembrane protein EcfT